MIERNLKEVEDLVFHTDERWNDRKYIASLRLKSLAVELFDLFLINSVKIVPDCPFDEPFDVVGKNGPYIFSLWHGSLFGCLYFFSARTILSLFMSSIYVRLARDKNSEIISTNCENI